MRYSRTDTRLLFATSGMVFPFSAAYAQTTWHVDDDACPGPGSGSESDPFCSIQTAIDTATDGDEVVVRAGTYLENINYLGKSITVRSSDPEDPDTVATTIIDGSGALEEDTFGSVVTIIQGEASGQVLNGLTLRGGIGRKSGILRRGGAVYVNNASPTISNCLLTNNRAWSGGGLYCVGEEANPVVSNCTIRSNASRYGGGLYSSAGSSPQIMQCWILNNTSEFAGAGLYGTNGSLEVHNSVIAGNVANYGGAVALSGQGTAAFLNSTIVANKALLFGGAGSMSNSSATLRNCISWGNAAPEGSEFHLCTAVLSVDFCDIQGGQEAVELLLNSTLLWGVGNIDADPLFLGTQPRNEHLSAGSPCIDAGDPLFIPGPGERDIDGDGRVINLIVDMGADEFNPDCNGNGIPDDEDITNGTSVDCNNNGVPDECLHLEIDCNENTLPDECDIETGDSEDCNGNGVPDECLFLEIDCNENAVPDECDIDRGTSDDCNDDGQPDDCEPDCNGNGVNDECDISSGSSDDCDLNGVPDDCGPDCNNNGTLDLCDISEGTSEDCSGNEIPDECEPDCNSNGEADSCDIESGLSEDVNRSGVPDECEPRVMMYVDDDATGQPVQDGTIENPFATIGQALDAAPTDQALVEVVVADGIYVGNGNKNLDFGGKILTLRSVNGPQSTIIDCQGAGRGFSFISGETRDAILDGFTIRNGRAHNGGAIECKHFSSPTIRNCLFIHNVSEGTGRGGGLHLVASAALVTHCAFIGNIAEGSGRGGGGIFAASGSTSLLPAIQNCLIVGNTAYQGGGIWASIDLNIQNCTIARNSAANQGGGVYVHLSALVTVSNCILWGDEAALGSEVYLRGEGSSLTANYSNVQGGQGGVEGPGMLIWESGNIDADPLFVDADQGDYHLLPGSPAIDAGDSTAVPPDVSDLDGDGDTSEPIPFDLDGRPRFLAELDTPDTGNPDGVHAIVDMGPYELGEPGCPDLDDDGVVTICHAPPGNPDNSHTMTVSANVATTHLAHGDTCGPCEPEGCAGITPPGVPEGQTVWYVDDDNCPESGSGSQADPFCKIQDGIIASDHGDVVLVAPGTYFENVPFMGKAITVQSHHPTDPDAVACTIIDGSQAEGDSGAYVVGFVEGEDSESILQGFTITHGSQGSSGGGIICRLGSDPTIANCVISNNSAQWGGGIRLEGSSPTIRDCTITQNSALLGGGIWADADSNPVISDCSISDNSAGARGGGISTFGNSTVTDCVFAGNTTAVAEAHGAAIYNGGGAALVVAGCVFSNNSTNTFGRGGGIFNDVESQVTASNCVFEGNIAGWGGGIYSILAGSMTLSNCTFRQNTASFGSGGGVLSERADLVMTNCIFEGNIAATSQEGAQQGGLPGSGNRPGPFDPTRQTAAVTIGYGGGLSVVDGQASVMNCLFIGNIGFRGGAVSCISESSLDLTHCTISGNHADATGGGVYVSGSLDVTVDNCILWNDTAPEGPEILIYADPGTLAVAYSDIEGGEEGIGGGDSVNWGDGNIDADPLFVDPYGGDYRLPSGSPCVDAGDNFAVPSDTGDLDNDGDTDEPVPIDLDGAPRFANDFDTADSGNPDGIHPIVDMGAYELEGSECADDDGDGQVTICHLPPGNSGNPQTMSVNQNNLPAHLAHGDSCGPCAEDDGAPPDDGESEASACPADVDGDGAVNGSDLAELLATWGVCPAGADCTADIDADGDVGATDLSILLNNWNSCS